MYKKMIIERSIPPISRWIARTFFHESKGRTVTTKAEEEGGIPREKFHAALIVGAMIAGVVALLFLGLTMLSASLLQIHNQIPELGCMVLFIIIILHLWFLNRKIIWGLFIK